MTRTYARQETRWDLDLLKMLVEAGDAKEFPNGIYVVKTDEGSFAVRPHQIISREEKLAIVLNTPSTEEFLTQTPSPAPDSADEDALLAKFGA